MSSRAVLAEQPHVNALKAAAAIAAVFAAPGHAQDENAFLRGLERIEQMAAKGSWRSAERQLQKLLSDHEGHDYVRARIERICRDLEECRFHLRHRPPSPERVVKGRLLRYDRRSRHVSIRYDAANLAEFHRVPKLDASFHEIVFSGPYTITVSGRFYPAEGAGIRVFVCEDEGGIVEVIFGYSATRSRTGAMASLRSYTNDGHTDLIAPIHSPATAGQPFLATVEVSERSVRAIFNGKPLFATNKPRQVFGRFGVTTRGFDQISVQGIAGPAWIQGKIDRHVQAQREKFRSAFDPLDHLPQWLSETAATPNRTAATPPATPPPASGSIAREVAALGAIRTLINQRNFRAALGQLTAGNESDTAARDYLRAMCLSALNRPDEALAACDRACHADPGFAESHGLRARIYAQLRRFDDAIEELLGMIDRHPAHATAHQFLTLLLFQRGRLDDAAAVLQHAREHGVHIPDVTALEEHLNRARRGPSWRRTYSHNSEHFQVRSNVDQRTCIEAARALEKALRTYSSQLGQAPTRGRSQVYVFASEHGYHDYCSHVMGGSRRHTAGLYNPSLKQLLIWSLPNYDEMLHTVRHEGLHQYLDMVMDEPPLWFNEGLAMYYERGDPPASRPDLLAVLDRRGIRPLGEFLQEDAEAFYADATRSYAQSWAVVHFLRESSPGTRRIFDRLFAELQKPISNRAAIDRALGSISLASLEREFTAWVRRMREAAAPIK